MLRISEWVPHFRQEIMVGLHLARQHEGKSTVRFSNALCYILLTYEIRHVLTIRACSRPIVMTVLLMILSRDTTMSWMCLKVSPWEKQNQCWVKKEGRLGGGGGVEKWRNGQALFNFLEWKHSADITASGFHAACRNEIVFYVHVCPGLYYKCSD